MQRFLFYVAYVRLIVSAELQQEVLVSLIQTDPDIIDYLLRRKLSGSYVTTESGAGLGGRRDTGASLDSVGASTGSLSPTPMEPRSSLEGGLSSQVFLSVLKMNQSRKQHNSRYEVRPGKSVRHMRQFHSHHNLLSLAQPALCAVSSTSSQQYPADAGSVWVRQAPPEESKASFWDFFTGKGSSSETLV